MKKRFLLALFGFIFVGLQAAPVRWPGGADGLPVGKEMQRLPDLFSHLGIDEIARDSFAARFEMNGKTLVGYDLNLGFHWLKISIDNTSHETALLEIGDAFLPFAELYFKTEAGGGWQIQRSGNRILLTDKPVESHNQVFRLPPGSRDYYLRVESFANPLPFKIWSEPAFKKQGNRQLLFFGMLAGLLFFAIIINLLLYLSLRKRSYLIYAGVVFTYLLITMACLDGYGIYLFPKIDLTFWYLKLPPFSSIFACLFCLSLLDLKRYSRPLYWACLALAGYFFVVAATHLFIPTARGQLILNQGEALVVLFFIGATGIVTGRKGNRMGYYLAAAYLIFFFFVILEVLYIYTGKPERLFGITHSSYAMLLESFILSYLLSKRFEWEQAEMQASKDEAQRQVLEKTLENEQIVLNQNVVLEAQVNARTGQLQLANNQLNLSLETVRHEREKSDSLLRNILPEATALELKEKGRTTPQVYPSVTVLFADIKDFTKSTIEMSPEQLVSDLHECFSQFDEIVRRHGIEKIKTIGDAYLAVGGLPVAFPRHADKAVLAALDMQAFVRDWQIRKKAAGLPAWEIRIGLHTGPIVAGVVGSHKFAYDIWGDTVNTAARMETHSETGKINISAATRAMLAADSPLRCTPRGVIEVKGKGMMEMFWVENLPTDSPLAG